MSWFARLIYRALVWKERQRAHLERGPHPGKPGTGAAHLKTGSRGETLAYWYLRQAGYTIVSRNRRWHGRPGELDLVGWDGPVLTFVEVKTRSSAAPGTPELPVTSAQKKHIARGAKEYLKHLRNPVTYRFDVVCVYWDSEAGYKVRLIKDAFKG